jgi:hypothetical protein
MMRTGAQQAGWDAIYVYSGDGRILKGEKPSEMVSLDHLVGAREQRRRQVEAEGLSGLLGGLRSATTTLIPNAHLSTKPGQVG